MARTGYKPTPHDRRRVMRLAGYGIPQPAIAELTVNLATGKGISLETLQRHYKRELKLGAEHANANVARSLYLKAIGDSNQAVQAATFWLRCRAGWVPTEHLELTGANNGAIAYETADGIMGKLLPEAAGRREGEATAEIINLGARKAAL